jgi:hypothetical protein
MLGFMLNKIGNLVYYSAITSGVLITIVGGFTYLTKPDENTFKPYIQSHIKNNEDDNSNKSFQYITKYVDAIVIEKTYEIDVKDYVFAKYAKVKTPDNKEMHFIGALQTWVEL